MRSKFRRERSRGFELYQPRLSRCTRREILRASRSRAAASTAWLICLASSSSWPRLRAPHKCDFVTPEPFFASSQRDAVLLDRPVENCVTPINRSDPARQLREENHINCAVDLATTTMLLLCCIVRDRCFLHVNTHTHIHAQLEIAAVFRAALYFSLE